MAKQKIIFMGTPVFATAALRVLIESDYDIVAVYTQPPKARDRGQKCQESPVHLLAAEHGIPVFTPKNFKDPLDVAQFASHQADLAVVAAYGLLLPRAILEAPRLGCVNIHASILPRWRGAAPIQRALMARDENVGITLMQMDVGLDTGDMIAISQFPATDTLTFGQLHDQLAALGATLLKDNLPNILSQNITLIKQPEDKVTYAAKLEKREGLLDWSESALVLEARVRALNPWPGTWFIFDNMQIKVHQACLVPVVPAEICAFPAGTFFNVPGDDLCVLCANQTALSIKIAQRPGGKALQAKDFLAGMPVLREQIKNF